MEDFARAHTHSNPAKNNLYLLCANGSRINFFVDPKINAQLEAFAAVLNAEGGRVGDVRYAYPRKQPVRLAVDTFMQESIDVEADADGEWSPGPSSKRPRTLTSRLFNHVNQLLLPLLEEVQTDALSGCETLREMTHDPTNTVACPATPRRAYFVFSNAWLAPADYVKLRTLLEWHPEYKNKLSACYGSHNLFPFTRFMPFEGPTQLDITANRVLNVWQTAAIGVKHPTVRLSELGLTAYVATQKLIDNAHARNVAADAAHAVFNVEPYGPDSVVDLFNPNLMCVEYLLEIFNPERPAKALHYLNLFFADVYTHNLVYYKTLDELTKCVKFMAIKRSDVKQRFSFLNYEGTDPEGKKVKLNVLQFYLDHHDHLLYDTTTFMPGHPNVTVNALAPTHTNGNTFQKEARVLNTCPPAVYFMYKMQYGQDMITASRIPDMNHPNIEWSYFGRMTDAEPLMAVLGGKNLSATCLREDWEGQVISEGANACLYIVLFHIWFVLCNRNKELFDRFNAFFARILVNPCGQDKQFLVLSGLMGAGKTNFINYIGTHLFGEGTLYQFCGGSSDRLVGKYTGQFDNSVLVALDESTFRKDEGVQNALKSICTDRLRTTEQKFQESKLIRNFLHVVMMLNNPLGLPVEPGDRRYIFCECNQELAATYLYHAIVQPRFATRYCMMVYGRWLETQARLHDNTVINFFTRPPFTPVKQTCILARMMDDMPELFWWHTCLKERRVRKLSLMGPNLKSTKDAVVYDTHKTMAKSFDLPYKNEPYASIEAAVMNACKDIPVTDTRKKCAHKQLWNNIHAQTGTREDKDWPVRVTIDDLYETYRTNAGKGNNSASKNFITAFAESLQSCVTVKRAKNRDPANPDAITVKLPCLYGCRAQFHYFLKYKCVRDKQLIYVAAGYNPHDMPAAPEETWVDILFEQARLEGRPSGFHRNCKFCAGCSELWREYQSKSGSSNCGHIANDTQASGSSIDVGALSTETHRICAADYGRRQLERGVDSPAGQSPHSQHDYHSTPSSPALACLQSGRTGRGAQGGSRVQDSSDEEGSSNESNPNRSSPLSSSSDEYALYSGDAGPRNHSLDS